MDEQTPGKKKFFVMLQSVKEFMRDQPGEVKQELNGIIWKLETEGALTMPFGEKLDGENLFAIRVIQTANIRIFYAYGLRDFVFGLHGYVKKTQDIPEKEKIQARKTLRELMKGGYIR